MKDIFFDSKPVFISTIILILTFLVSISIAEIDNDVPIGWAAVPSSESRSGIDGIDLETTTGGGDGKVVTAKTNGEFASYLKSSEPLVIIAEGSFSGHIVIGSNKTVIGAGSGATFKGGFDLVKVNNIIFRNFKISGGDDAFGFGGAHHVWIDHCDLSACADGLIDITTGSDNVTVSWVRFSKHHKTMLINHGKNVEMDNDRLNVTLHHNFFDGSDTRNPRVGFGQVHILNNYYNANSGYAIHTYWNTEVRIERNYFNNVKDALSDHKGGKQGDWPGPGYVVLIENYTNVPGSIQKETTTDPERIFYVDKFYLYDWIVTKDVMQVPDVVQKGAGTGAEWGKLGALPTPGQGYSNVNTNPTLKWTKVGSEASNKVYFGTTNPPPEATTVNGYSYKPGNLKEGTVYYWKINDGKVWKFRTKGTPVPIAETPAPTQAKPFVYGNSNPEALKFHFNSARNEVTLNLNGTGIRGLAIHDCFGKTVSKEIPSGNVHTISVKNLPSGVYYISLTSKHGTCYRQFIKI